MTTKRVRLTETADLVASYFRLLDLPFDLREYVTQFVDRRTAACLLTVSSGFHELFARSVWRYIDKSVFNSNASNETRKSAFVRYGRFVRHVDFLCIFDGVDHSIDLSQLVPNVTVYKFDIGNYSSSKEQALHLIQSVSSFHGLRSLEVAFGTDYHKFCLVPLADALVGRQQNQYWQRLQRLKIIFLPYNNDFSWTVMASFVVKIAPLQIDDFEIIINTSSSEYPTAEQMALVGPHITSSPNIKISDDISRCEACHNRIIYSPSPPSGNDQSVVFSRLMCLGVKLCCASSAVYDYADFTAARFPRIETVGITISNCGRDTMSTDPAFVHPVLSQYWPNVSTMELYGNATSSALYTILDRNPQITDLNVEISSSGTDIDQSSHFSLADIVKRLPSLDTLGIVLNIYNKLYGNSADDIGNNEDSDLSFIKNSRLKDIHIYFVTMTSDCLEMLYMLPKLEKLTIMECNLDNQQAALEKINRIQQLNSTMESGKYGANIQHIKFEKVGLKGYGYWPAELVIAMMAAAPNIKSVEFDKVTSELFSAITKRFPNVKSKYRIISDYDSDAECSDYSDFSDVSDGESSDDYESDDQITI